MGGVKIGGEEIVVIAGPCSVESREQLLETAHGVKRAGATMLAVAAVALAWWIWASRRVDWQAFPERQPELAEH